MPAALTWRQEQLYINTFDLWKPGYIGGQDPEDTTYELAESGVKGLLQTKSSVDSVADLAVLESDDLLTVDTLNFAELQTIDTSWICVNKTLLENGQPHPQYGVGWIVRGEPSRTTGTTFKPTGKTTVYASRLSRLPATVIP